MCVSASVGCLALGSTISGFNMRTGFGFPLALSLRLPAGLRYSSHMFLSFNFHTLPVFHTSILPLFQFPNSSSSTSFSSGFPFIWHQIRIVLLLLTSATPFRLVGHKIGSLHIYTYFPITRSASVSLPLSVSLLLCISWSLSDRIGSRYLTKLHKI